MSSIRWIFLAIGLIAISHLLELPGEAETGLEMYGKLVHSSQARGTEVTQAIDHFANKTDAQRAFHENIRNVSYGDVSFEEITPPYYSIPELMIENGHGQLPVGMEFILAIRDASIGLPLIEELQSQGSMINDPLRTIGVQAMDDLDDKHMTERPPALAQVQSLIQSDLSRFEIFSRSWWGDMPVLQIIYYRRCAFVGWTLRKRAKGRILHQPGFKRSHGRPAPPSPTALTAEPIADGIRPGITAMDLGSYGSTARVNWYSTINCFLRVIVFVVIFGSHGAFGKSAASDDNRPSASKTGLALEAISDLLLEMLPMAALIVSCWLIYLDWQNQRYVLVMLLPIAFLGRPQLHQGVAEMWRLAWREWNRTQIKGSCIGYLLPNTSAAPEARDAVKNKSGKEQVDNLRQAIPQTPRNTIKRSRSLPRSEMRTPLTVSFADAQNQEAKTYDRNRGRELQRTESKQNRPQARSQSRGRGAQSLSFPAIAEKHQRIRSTVIQGDLDLLYRNQPVSYPCSKVISAMAGRHVSNFSRKALNPQEIGGHSQVGWCAVDTLRKLNVQLDSNLWQGMVKAQGIAASASMETIGDDIQSPDTLSWVQGAKALYTLQDLCVLPNTTSRWISAAVTSVVQLSDRPLSQISTAWKAEGESIEDFGDRLSGYFSPGADGIKQLSVILQAAPGLAALSLAKFLMQVKGPEGYDQGANDSLKKAIARNITAAKQHLPEGMTKGRQTRKSAKARQMKGILLSDAVRQKTAADLIEHIWTREISATEMLKSKSVDGVDQEYPMLGFFWLASEALGWEFTILMTPEQGEDGLLAVNMVGPLRIPSSRSDAGRFAILRGRSEHFTAVRCTPSNQMQGAIRHAAINSGLMGHRFNAGITGWIQAVGNPDVRLKSMLKTPTGACLSRIGHQDEWMTGGCNHWKVVGPDPQLGACWSPGIAMASGISVPATEWLQLMDRPCTAESSRKVPLNSLVNVLALIAKARKGRLVLTPNTTTKRGLRGVLDIIELATGPKSYQENRMDFFISNSHCVVHKPILNAAGERISIIMDTVNGGKEGSNLVIRATQPVLGGFSLPIHPDVIVSLIFDEAEHQQCTMEILRQEKTRLTFPDGGHMSTVIPTRVGEWSAAKKSLENLHSRDIYGPGIPLHFGHVGNHGWSSKMIGFRRIGCVSIGNANLGGGASPYKLARAVSLLDMPDVLITTEASSKASGSMRLPPPVGTANGMYHGITESSGEQTHGLGMYISKDIGLRLEKWQGEGPVDCLAADLKIEGTNDTLAHIVGVYNPLPGITHRGDFRCFLDCQDGAVSWNGRTISPVGFDPRKLILAGDFNPDAIHTMTITSQLESYLEHLGGGWLTRAGISGPTHVRGRMLDAILFGSQFQEQATKKILPHGSRDHFYMKVNLRGIVQMTRNYNREGRSPESSESALKRMKPVDVKRVRRTQASLLEANYGSDITKVCSVLVRNDSQLRTELSPQRKTQLRTSVIEGISDLVEIVGRALESSLRNALQLEGRGSGKIRSQTRNRRTQGGGTKPLVERQSWRVWKIACRDTQEALRAAIDGDVLEEGIGERPLSRQLSILRRSARTLVASSPMLEMALKSANWTDHVVHPLSLREHDVLKDIAKQVDRELIDVTLISSRGGRADGHVLRQHLSQCGPAQAHWVLREQLDRQRAAAAGTTEVEEIGLRPVEAADGTVVSRTQEVLEAHADHFRVTTQRKVVDTEQLLESIGDALPKANHELNLRCTRDFEIENAIQRLRRNKAIGPDSISSDALKDCAMRSGEYIPESSNTLISAVRAIYNAMVTTGDQPEAFRTGYMRPLEKRRQGSAPLKCSEFRPICWSSTLSKVVSLIANQKVRVYAERNGLFGRDQAGFRQGKNCAQAYSAVLEWMKQQGAEGGVLLFFDIKAAYDSCQWEVLRAIMTAQGWGSEAVDFLMSRLRMEVKVRDPGTGELSSPVKKEAGTPQGEILSPALFLVFIAPLLESIKAKRAAMGHHQRIVVGNRSVECSQSGYADDYVAMASHKEEAREAFRIVEDMLRMAGLQLGYKRVEASGAAKKTAMLPFGRAADEFDDESRIGLAAGEIGQGRPEDEVVPRGKSYVYLGLMISTKRIKATAAELGAEQDGSITAVTMMPHVTRRVAMAIQDAQLVTQTAVGNNWSLRLHAQIMHQTAITGGLYGVDAAAIATGWERFEDLGERTEILQGVMMNKKVLGAIDGLLNKVRWMLVTGSADMRGNLVQGRRVPTLVVGTEVFTATAAGRVFRSMVTMGLKAWWSGTATPVYDTVMRLQEANNADESVGGPIAATAKLVRTSGAHRNAPQQREQRDELLRTVTVELGRQEIRKAATKITQAAMRREGGALNEYVRDLFPGIYRGTGLKPETRRLAVMGAILDDQLTMGEEGVFGPGSIPTSVALQRSGQVARRVAKVRCMIYPRNSSATSDLVDNATSEMRKHERGERSGRSDWQGRGWGDMDIESRDQARKGWATSQLVRDPWQASPGTSAGLPVQMKATMQKVRAAISWSEESGTRKSLAYKMMTVIRQSVDTESDRATTLWWRGTSIRAWPLVTGVRDLMDMEGEPWRKEQRKPKGLLERMETIWARGVAQAQRDVLLKREAQRARWEKKWWRASGDMGLSLARAKAPALVPYGL